MCGQNEVNVKIILQGTDVLDSLMEHPILVSASESLNAIPKRKFSVSEESNAERSTSKCVYVFQREYATVDPALVDVCSNLRFSWQLTCSSSIKLINLGCTQNDTMLYYLQMLSMLNMTFLMEADLQSGTRYNFYSEPD